jgi:fatty-acyl-CoA synthase
MMLTMSHAVGPNEPAVRDLTLGELLQWAAETTPERIALIAGVPEGKSPAVDLCRAW